MGYKYYYGMEKFVTQSPLHDFFLLHNALPKFPKGQYTGQ